MTNFVESALSEFDKEFKHSQFVKYPAIKHFLKAKLEEAYLEGQKKGFVDSSIKTIAEIKIQEQETDFYRMAKEQIVKDSLRSLIPEINGMKKVHHEFECGTKYECFCDDQNCRRFTGKYYNQAIDDIIKAITERTSSPEEKL